MIDVLVDPVGRYRVDPNEADEYDRTALHWAALFGRLRTLKHLVEKYNVDIHRVCWLDDFGETALDYAERHKTAKSEHDTTECASYLRELGAINWEWTDESSSDED